MYYTTDCGILFHCYVICIWLNLLSLLQDFKANPNKFQLLHHDFFLIKIAEYSFKELVIGSLFQVLDYFLGSLLGENVWMGVIYCRKWLGLQIT